MFRTLYENSYSVCLTLAFLLFICVLVYLFVGIIIRKCGVYLKQLLVGEEYMFALISSVVIFLIFSFPIALLVWIIICFSMNYFFKNNRRLVSYIDYFEQNKNVITNHQYRLLSQLNPCLSSGVIIFWIKDFQHLKHKTMCKMDTVPQISHFKYKHSIFPFSIFAAGTIGIFVSLLTYGYLVEDNSSNLMLLLENYAILSCVLFVLYHILYLYIVGNIFHNMYGQKRLFKIIFIVFSIFMYICVSVISIN